MVQKKCDVCKLIMSYKYEFKKGNTDDCGLIYKGKNICKNCVQQIVNLSKGK